MTPLAIGETAAICCFWVGALLLMTLALAWRAALAAERRAARQWQSLEAVLGEQRERLYRLLPRDVPLNEACRRAEFAHTREERLAAEADIARLMRVYGTDAAMRRAGITPPTENVRTELRDWAERTEIAAIRYNETAQAVNTVRGVFPIGLVLRARASDDLSLFDAQP